MCNYVFNRLNLINSGVPEAIKIPAGQFHVLRGLVHPRALDDIGAMGMAVIKAKKAGFTTDMSYITKRASDFILKEEHRLPDGTPEIPGTWFGYDNDNKLIFEPPAMRRVSAEAYDNREMQTTVATLSIKVSPVIARLLTKLLNKHINNQRKMVANQPKESVINTICMEEVETAEETLNGIDKALKLWETENNIQ